MLWVKISVVGSRDLYVCSFYRPNVNDVQSMENLGNSLNMISNKNYHIWLAGDFNLPGFNWLENNIKPSCPFPNLHEQFLDILDDNGLTQLVDKPTCE